MRYASIDTGSNAVRMMIADISSAGGQTNYKKNTLIRVPLRLGDDAFIDRKLSARKTEDLVNTMKAFRLLMNVYKVSDYMACATSAMREASNAAEVIERIREEADLDLQVITGEKEAGIIFSSHLEAQLDKAKNYLYIDVGGGSTELSIFSKGKIKASTSFNIGTIRMLDHKDSEETWEAMKQFVREHTGELRDLEGIGTGGNINKLFKLSGEKEGKPLSLAKLKSTYQFLKSHSLKERIQVLGLKQDRADVIIPASEIYLSVLQWGRIKYIHVPQRGLVDGMISLLIEKNQGK